MLLSREGSGLGVQLAAEHIAVLTVDLDHEDPRATRREVHLLLRRDDLAHTVCPVGGAHHDGLVRRVEVVEANDGLADDGVARARRERPGEVWRNLGNSGGSRGHSAEQQTKQHDHRGDELLHCSSLPGEMCRS